MITLGNTSIRCVLAPGHTYGTMAFFFHATAGETARYVGYWGGVGFLTVYGGFCRDYGLPVGKHLRMAESIQKLRQEPVELMLGNHPPQNCTLEKRTWMWEHPGENPFVNPAGWTEFLDTVETRLAEFVALGYGD